MDNALVITVPTGRNSVYRFVKKAGMTNPIIEVETQSEGADDMPGRHYHTFEGRGATALERLVERCAELEKFFNAIKLLSHTQEIGHEFMSFFDKNDVDYNGVEGAEEAWELVGQMIEEAMHRDDRS